MATTLELAKKLAQGIAASDKARALLKVGQAWALAFLLAEWRNGRDLAAAGLSDIAMAFRFFKGALDRFIDKAQSASDAAARAGAASLFDSAVREIGEDRLQQALASRVFARAADVITQQVPIPEEVSRAFSGTSSARNQDSTPPQVAPMPAPNRVQAYNAADYRRPKASADNGEMAFYRRQLNGTSISPELRWWYEQRMEASGMPIYQTDDDARAVYTAMLAGPLHPDLRKYYQGKLDSLKGSQA